MGNIIELLSWDFMDKLSNWRMRNEFDWATSPTNVNAFHTFQANAISELIEWIEFLDEKLRLPIVFREWIRWLSFVLYFSDSFGDFAVSVLSAWIGVRIPWWLISLINFLRINLNFFTAASLHCVLCTSLAIFYDYDAIISLAARSFSLSGKKIHFVRFHRALNYGSIGSILAHELTHGEIDDEVQLPQWMGDYSQWM